MAITPLHPLRCDVFCNVIDNFGDAGVCWRLVRELAEITDWQLRLVVDRPELITSLGKSNTDGVTVVAWGDERAPTDVADIVIEAFSCRIPEPYLDRMRSREHPPAWVSLEYLSAEHWIDGCHGLPSPDPRSGMVKHFFFPGFTPTSGGLIREKRLDALTEKPITDAARRDWLASIGIKSLEGHYLTSLFCYLDSPFAQLFESWKHAAQPVQCLLAAGHSVACQQKIVAIATAFDVTLSPLPFLTQDDYDRLLASCDVNFVRGEDSFVRAQWMKKPFVWQAYRQTDDTHLVKLAAFLDRYRAGMPPEAAAAIDALYQAWNDGAPWTKSLWDDFMAARSTIEQHNRAWSKTLSSHGNLAENLAAFCESKL